MQQLHYNYKPTDMMCKLFLEIHIFKGMKRVFSEKIEG